MAGETLLPFPFSFPFPVNKAGLSSQTSYLGEFAVFWEEAA